VQVRRDERTGEDPVDAGRDRRSGRTGTVDDRQDLRRGLGLEQVRDGHRLRSDPHDHKVGVQGEHGVHVCGRIELDHVGLREVQAQEERQVGVGLDEDDPGPEGSVRAFPGADASVEAGRKDAQRFPLLIADAFCGLD
jgi:hypothetical protein